MSHLPGSFEWVEKLLGCTLPLGLVLPWYLTQKATGSVVAGCGAGLAGLALTVAILVWLSARRDRYRVARRRRRDRTYAASDMAAIDAM